jgi:hypothetical protein
LPSHHSALPIVISPAPTIFMDDDLVIIDSGPSMSVVSSLSDVPQPNSETSATPEFREIPRSTFVGAPEANPAVGDFRHRVPGPAKWCGTPLPKAEQDDRHPHGTEAGMRRHQQQQGFLNAVTKGSMGSTSNIPNLKLPFRGTNDSSRECPPLPPINHGQAYQLIRPLCLPEQVPPPPPPPVSFRCKKNPKSKAD